MRAHTQDHVTAATRPFMAAGYSLLQRKCACGESEKLTGECDDCRRKRLLQRRAIADAPATVPPVVHEALRAHGQPLDGETRRVMEANFGHDFSRVRVHTDARAAESARAVNALAYTVGRHVVFDEGQYAPHSADGRRLLAHELTHVAQQREQRPDSAQIQIDPQESKLEAEARRVSEQAFNPVRGAQLLQTPQASAPQLQRQPRRGQAGTREATVEVRWSEDGDEFYDRLVNALARSRGFRGIDASEFGSVAGVGQISGFRIDVGSFHTLRNMRHSDRGGARIKLHVSAFYNPEATNRTPVLSAVKISTDEKPANQEAPVLGTPTTTTQQAPPKETVPDEEAIGAVTLSGGQVSVYWYDPPKTGVPDEREIWNELNYDVVSRHPEGEPADDSKFLKFIRTPGKDRWYLHWAYDWTAWQERERSPAPPPAPSAGCRDDDVACIAQEIRNKNLNLARVGARGIEIVADPLGSPLTKVADLRQLAEECIGKPECLKPQEGLPTDIPDRPLRRPGSVPSPTVKRADKPADTTPDKPSTPPSTTMQTTQTTTTPNVTSTTTPAIKHQDTPRDVTPATPSRIEPQKPITDLNQFRKQQAIKQKVQQQQVVASGKVANENQQVVQTQIAVGQDVSPTAQRTGDVLTASKQGTRITTGTPTRGNVSTTTTGGSGRTSTRSDQPPSRLSANTNLVPEPYPLAPRALDDRGLHIFYRANRDRYPKEIQQLIDDIPTGPRTVTARRERYNEIDRAIRALHTQEGNRRITGGKGQDEALVQSKRGAANEGERLNALLTGNKQLNFTGKTKSGELVELDSVRLVEHRVIETKLSFSRFTSEADIMDQMRRQSTFAKDWGFSEVRWEVYDSRSYQIARRVRNEFSQLNPELGALIRVKNPLDAF